MTTKDIKWVNRIETLSELTKPQECIHPKDISEEVMLQPLNPSYNPFENEKKKNKALGANIYEQIKQLNKLKLNK